MLAAQGYQESQLDNSVRSKAGAIGIMQVMPLTAKDPNVDIANIAVLENNIHAAAKYMRYVMDTFFPDAKMDPFNRTMFAFASYNAGPAKIAKLRRQAVSRGLDPDQWFGQVERVVAERIGRETVQYVSNILKYYVVYRRIDELQERKERALEAASTKQF
jgi:membrane-bound lytic murein transglycosylase MltF